MALAGVCVIPQMRNKGLGSQIVKRTFEEVDSGRYPFCLFQTEDYNFYERFGASIVTNEFYNSKAPDKYPWIAPYVMIYPDTEKWPKGEIDLNGPRF